MMTKDVKLAVEILLSDFDLCGENWNGRLNSRATKILFAALVSGPTIEALDQAINHFNINFDDANEIYKEAIK